MATKRKKKRSSKKKITRTTHKAAPRKRRKARRSNPAAAAPRRRRRARRHAPKKHRRAHARRRNPAFPWEALGAVAIGAAAFGVGKAIPALIPSTNFDQDHRLYAELGVGALAAGALAAGVMFKHPLLGVGAAAGLGVAAVGDQITSKVQGLMAAGSLSAPKLGALDPFKAIQQEDPSVRQLMAGKGIGDTGDAGDMAILAGIRADIGGIGFDY